VMKPYGRPRHRWEDNIKIDLMEIGCEGVEGMYLAQKMDQWQALVSTIIKHQYS